MPSYSTNDPKGWCGDPSRGAALGRGTLKGPADFNGKIYLRKVRLCQGGYDVNGTYFGIGAPLYWYANDDDSEIEDAIDGMLRAGTRWEARRKVLAMYPNAKVRR